MRVPKLPVAYVAVNGISNCCGSESAAGSAVSSSNLPAVESPVGQGWKLPQEAARRWTRGPPRPVIYRRFAFAVRILEVLRDFGRDLVQAVGGAPSLFNLSSRSLRRGVLSWEGREKLASLSPRDSGRICRRHPSAVYISRRPLGSKLSRRSYVLRRLCFIGSRGC